MSSLADIIKTEIRSSSAITFARFMELALYHPEHGYYASGKVRIGKEGDFYTSPSVHPAFGETISKFISRAWEIMSVPDFTIVEMGAGKGFLALDILDSLKKNNPEFYERLRYLIVESSPSLCEQARGILSEHLAKIEWASSLSSLKAESVSGVFLSNELVDALPFHRAKFHEGRLIEIFVALQDKSFTEILGEPGADLTKYFDAYDLQLEEGQEVEANLEAGGWISSVSRILAKGFVLTIDYGFLAAELFSSERMKGTFKCLYKHQINENPYINIGEQDITAHVDFSNLIRNGDALGLNTLKYTTQGQFLIDWGILDILEENQEDDISAEKRRRAIKNLFLPESMGDKFKVLIQAKKMGDGIRNFYPESPFKISFQPPGDKYQK